MTPIQAEIRESIRASTRAGRGALAVALALALAPATSLAGDAAAGAAGAASRCQGHEIQGAASNRVLELGAPDAGRWRRAAEAPQADAAHDELIAQLDAIGYLAGSEQRHERTGVVFTSDRAVGGLNFFSSGHAPEAVLMDMAGVVLHRWRYELLDALPDFPCERLNANAQFWRRARLFENGDVVAIHEGLAILRVDRDSKLLWAQPHRAHHDLDVLPSGDLLVLTREPRLVPRVDPDEPILEDSLSVLDAETGELKRRISLLEAFERGEPQHSWRRASEAFRSHPRRRNVGHDRDIFHTNSVEVLDGRLAGRVPAFAAGNVLLSMGHLGLIAVLDPKQEKIVWSSTGGFSLQHDPTVTPAGDVMLFDNSWRRGRSRVVRIDPASQELRWQYAGGDARFFSQSCGTSQPLANGNALITESDRGRAFEVTAAGDVVWDFRSPHTAGERDELVATLFEVVRLAPDFPVGWLNAAP